MNYCRHKENKLTRALSCDHEWVSHWCGREPEEICAFCEEIRPKEKEE